MSTTNGEDKRIKLVWENENLFHLILTSTLFHSIYPTLAANESGNNSSIRYLETTY